MFKKVELWRLNAIKLKYNGSDDLRNGLCNLGIHIENLKKFNQNIIVTLNKFEEDSKEEIDIIKDYVSKYNVPFTINTAYKDGENGAIEIAKEILKCSQRELKQLYSLKEPLKNKIEILCKEICRAKEIKFEEKALDKIKRYSNLEYPICIAKTQYSLSDDPKKLGAPINSTLTVRDIKVNNGAKFITVYLGNILTMPGLSKVPNAVNIDLVNNEIVGLF